MFHNDGYRLHPDSPAEGWRSYIKRASKGVMANTGGSSPQRQQVSLAATAWFIASHSHRSHNSRKFCLRSKRRRRFQSSIQLISAAKPSDRSDGILNRPTDNLPPSRHRLTNQPAVVAIDLRFDRIGEFHNRTHQKYRSRTSSVSPGRSTVPAPATTRTKLPFWSRRLM